MARLTSTDPNDVLIPVKPPGPVVGVAGGTEACVAIMGLSPAGAEVLVPSIDTDTRNAPADATASVMDPFPT